MKTLKATLLTLSALSIMSFGNPEGKSQKGTVPVDLSKSEIEWNGKKVTGEHFGTIDIKTGNLVYDNGVLTGGEFVINMPSITVTDLEGEGKQKLESHLKSDDFFGVAKYPTSKLKISKVVPAGKAGMFNINGDLTIKEITKPIQFEAKFNGNIATAEIILDRAEYDIRYGSGSFFDNLGDKLIYDDFTLKVKLVQWQPFYV